MEAERDHRDRDRKEQLYVGARVNERAEPDEEELAQDLDDLPVVALRLVVEMQQPDRAAVCGKCAEAGEGRDEAVCKLGRRRCIEQPAAPGCTR